MLNPPVPTVLLAVLPSGAVTVAMYDVALMTAAKLVMLMVMPLGLPLLHVRLPVAVAGAGIEYVPTASDPPVVAVNVAYARPGAPSTRATAAGTARRRRSRDSRTRGSRAAVADVGWVAFTGAFCLAGDLLVSTLTAQPQVEAAFKFNVCSRTNVLA